MIADMRREKMMDDDESDSEDGEAEDTDYPAQTASSHRLAADLGVNPHNMQVMKASFFGDGDIELELGNCQDKRL